MQKLLIPLLLICISSSLLTAQVDKAEKALVASINRHNASHTELLRKLVNMKSGTMNFEGVQAVGQTLRTKFDALGMETQWVAL